MIMKLENICLSVALLVAAPLAVAANPSSYIAADLGQSTSVDGCAGLSGSGSCKETDVALRVGFGYQLNNNIGFEFGYVDSGRATASNGSGVKATEIQFVGTGAIPLARKFSVTGRAGLSVWKLDADVITLNAEGRDFLVGAGVQYDLDSSLSFRAQYETHKVGTVVTGRHSLNMLSAGMIIKF